MTGRRRKEEGAVKMMPKHVPRRDPTVPADMGGHWWCRCRLPASHPVHDLPDTPDDIAAAEARRYKEAR